MASYESPTIEGVGGDEPVATLGLAVYFVIVLAVKTAVAGMTVVVGAVLAALYAAVAIKQVTWFWDGKKPIQG